MSVAAAPQTLPEQPGVYGFLFRDGDALLDDWEYCKFSDWRPTRIADLPLLSVGSTTKTLRERIERHLFSTTRCSSLRRTVGTLLYDELDLCAYGDPGHHGYHFGDDEDVLTDYMVEQTWVVYSESTTARKLEWSLILEHQPPLNIKGLEHTAFAQNLLELRRGLADEARPRG